MSSTLVLVHGAFAESASWDRVIHVMMGRDHRIVAPFHHGHRVIAAANPLRGLAADAASIADLVAHDRRAGGARRPLLRRSRDLERSRRRR